MTGYLHEALKSPEIIKKDSENAAGAAAHWKGGGGMKKITLNSPLAGYELGREKAVLAEFLALSRIPSKPSRKAIIKALHENIGAWDGTTLATDSTARHAVNCTIAAIELLTGKAVVA